MPGAGQRRRVVPRLPHTPWVLAGSVSKVFQRFFYYWKKKERKNTKTPGNPKAIWCRLWSISGTGPLENPLALQVGICIVAAKALGVLAHVATFWAGLRRGQQVGKAAFLATQWGLETGGGSRSGATQEPPFPCPVSPPTPVPSAGGCGHWAQGRGPGALLQSSVGRN